MYCVEVYTLLNDNEKLTMYLGFTSYGSAVNCIDTLTATEEKEYTPRDYFECAMLYKERRGQLVQSEPIEFCLVLSYYDYAE